MVYYSNYEDEVGTVSQSPYFLQPYETESIFHDQEDIDSIMNLNFIQQQTSNQAYYPSERSFDSSIPQDSRPNLYFDRNQSDLVDYFQETQNTSTFFGEPSEHLSLQCFGHGPLQESPETKVEQLFELTTVAHNSSHIITYEQHQDDQQSKDSEIYLPQKHEETQEIQEKPLKTPIKKSKKVNGIKKEWDTKYKSNVRNRLLRKTISCCKNLRYKNFQTFSNADLNSTIAFMKIVEVSDFCKKTNNFSNKSIEEFLTSIQETSSVAGLKLFNQIWRKQNKSILKDYELSLIHI
eukprot:TRINITY_DN5017_c0_g1_i10.p1 TRINITY_DN5017_c0_g1~~TRINITY_DN5017_c0_g1_i10.p1  ORF type:complete len:293 (+),score=30.73 TRINITY_DN5017_c0_g1_i10:157-1035(+)